MEKGQAGSKPHDISYLSAFFMMQNLTAIRVEGYLVGSTTTLVFFPFKCIALWQI